MKNIISSALVLMGTGSAAFASNCGGAYGQPCAVPEISAMEGAAAVAAVLAVVALVWERRRRAA